MIQKHCPRLLQPFLAWYGRTTDHLWYTAGGTAVKVSADRGVDQGNPLANPVFAVAMIDPTGELRESLAIIDPSVSVIQFSDNIHICTLPSVLPLAGRELRRLWGPAGLSYSDDKQQTWSLSLDPLPVDYQKCRVAELCCLGNSLEQMEYPDSMDALLPQLGADTLGGDLRRASEKTSAIAPAIKALIDHGLAR